MNREISRLKNQYRYEKRSCLRVTYIVYKLKKHVETNLEGATT